MCICAEGESWPRERLGGEEGAVPLSPWPFDWDVEDVDDLLV